MEVSRGSGVRQFTCEKSDWTDICLILVVVDE